MRLSSNLLQVSLAVLIALATLKVTKQISAPILLALTTGVILSPVVERAARSRIPPAAVALTVTFGACCTVVLCALLIAPAVEEAIHELPMVVTRFQTSLDGLLAIGRNIEEVSKEVSEAVSAGPGDGGGADLPSTLDAILFAPQIAAQGLIFLGTLFFFILTRRQIYHWLGTVLPASTGHTPTEEILLFADRSVSRYFVTITLINALLGIAVGLCVYGFGLPSPTTWGVAAFLLNYLLYLGPALFAGALLVAGHMQFSGLMSFAPMASFLLLNLLEGYFLTPSILGQRLAINPLLIFTTLTVWLWLWGPTGGIIALPVLIWALTLAGLLDPPRIVPDRDARIPSV
ncbi:MAG: AI-2E family transporter [Rhodobacteraceae bacterium]|nr:AI-2E family transporter [Paracoccaceae bacterium]